MDSGKPRPRSVTLRKLRSPRLPVGQDRSGQQREAVPMLAWTAMPFDRTSQMKHVSDWAVRPDVRKQSETSYIREPSIRPKTADIREPGLVPRNITIAGHRTSVRLEPTIWEALQEISQNRQLNINDLISEIDQDRSASSLTSAIRVYVVEYLRTASMLRAASSTPEYDEPPANRSPATAEPVE
jgi:predicted DNA-binding ribbon-helix-helix protein